MFRWVQIFMQTLVNLVSRHAHEPFPTISFPWIARVEREWAAIRAEFDQVLVDRVRIPGAEYLSDDGNRGADRTPMSRGDEWRWLFLYGYGHKIEENCVRCPTTTRLVESIPGMSCAIFVVLAPGKHIPPHRGLYKGLLRYHLGVRIPGSPGSCRITVGGETRAWQEGRGFVLDDTFTHEVWNESEEERVILMIDIERPLPAPANWLNRLVLRWIHSTRYITDTIENARAVGASEAAVGVSSRAAKSKGYS
jgi:beta-hydroxylase